MIYTATVLYQISKHLSLCVMIYTKISYSRLLLIVTRDGSLDLDPGPDSLHLESVPQSDLEADWLLINRLANGQKHGCTHWIAPEFEVLTQ